MMGFDPRKWLTGLGPQTEPTVEQFRNYHVTPSTATGKYAAAGKPTINYGKKVFDQGRYTQAMEDYSFNEDIRQRKLAKMAELMEYGQKDLNPRPPSHNFVGESGGVEVSWPSMVGEQSYVDLDQPVDPSTAYEQEAEQRRRRLLARYLG